jgi:hypothetical protein
MANMATLTASLQFQELDGDVETEPLGCELTYDLMDEKEYQAAGAGTIPVDLGSIVTLKGYIIKPLTGTVEVKLDGEVDGHEIAALGNYIVLGTTANQLDLDHIGDCSGKILIFGNTV